MPQESMEAQRQLSISSASGASGVASDDAGTPSFGGSVGEDPGAVGGALVVEDLNPEAQQVLERDRLLHWWCLKQLPRYLRRLAKCAQAGPFLEPLPWRELGLLDYPQVVKKPMDLKTVSRALEDGSYEDGDGFVNPEYFWEDVTVCWDNCGRYYERDVEVEAYRMAEQMRVEAEALEREFWAELETFEASLETLDPNLQPVVAMTDVAARTVEDAAAAVYEDGSAVARAVVKRIGDWWWGDRAKPQPKPARPELKLAARTPLRQHFHELSRLRWGLDLTEDLEYVEASVLEALTTAWPRFQDDENEDEDEALTFEGAGEKVPIRSLVPAELLASKRWSIVRSRWNGGHSGASSRRSSTGSSRTSRGVSPAVSERSMLTLPRALPLPESSESDKNVATLDVDSLRRIMPRRAAVG